MRRHSTTVLMVLVIALATPLARAESVTAYGAGLRTCQSYLDARDGSITEEVSFVDWLGGYFSAVNRTSRHRNNFLGLGDLKGVLERLDATCRARPNLHFAEAAGILVLGAKPGPAAHAIGVTTYGSADKACQLFVEAREQRETEYWSEFMHWLGGYLSGVNAMSLSTDNVLGAAELSDAVQWLDTFCSSHPTTPFAMAVDALIAVPGGVQGSALAHVAQ